MEETGATAVEYGIIVAGIAAAMVVTAIALGPRVAALYASLVWPG